MSSTATVEDICTPESEVHNRYSVKLPWKVGHDSLPSNCKLSLSGMKGQIKELRKEPEVLEEYNTVIKEQLDSELKRKSPNG